MREKNQEVEIQKHGLERDEFSQLIGELRQDFFILDGIKFFNLLRNFFSYTLHISLGKLDRFLVLFTQARHINFINDLLFCFLLFSLVLHDLVHKLVDSHAPEFVAFTISLAKAILDRESLELDHNG